MWGASSRPPLVSRLAARWAAPAALAALGIVLFAAYLAHSRMSAASSESGGQALQAWDMLHGNVLLHGWTLSDVSFYTTELPEYMLVELVHGLNNDTMHVAAALSYTLIVLLAGLLAKGRETGRVGLVRFLIAVGIMLAPRDTPLLLGAPDHTGIHVSLLIIFLVVDRAPARWWTPVLVTVLLTWAQIADTLVLYEGAVPIAIACALRAWRRGGVRRENWLEVSLAAGAVISVAAAQLILKLIRLAGGFVVRPPTTSFAPARALPQNLAADLSRVLDVFGAKFFGMPIGPGLFVVLIGLVGAGLAAWAVGAGLRHLLGGQDLIATVLAIAIVVVLAAFVLGTKNDTNEIVGLLPLGAALAGRLLARRVLRGGLVPALALVLACYAGILAYDAVQPPQPDRPYAVTASWLEAHHLRYGLAGFWNAASVTVDSGDRVEVRPVRTFQGRVVTTLSESDATWYDPRQHYASFVLTRHWWDCSGVCVGVRSLVKSFGPAAVTYHVGPYDVLVWKKNLLTRLRTLNWCNTGWPWNTPARPCPGPRRAAPRPSGRLVSRGGGAEARQRPGFSVVLTERPGR
jgi:hypothetical protein